MLIPLESVTGRDKHQYISLQGWPEEVSFGSHISGLDARVATHSRGMYGCQNSVFNSSVGANVKSGLVPEDALHVGVMRKCSRGES